MGLHVELLQHTGEPEKLVSVAAKLCYSSTGISNIYDQLDEEKTEKFINMLMDLGHESPIEHVNFTFGIEGVSRSLLAQITRHRIASFSVKSQRYVAEGQFEYIVPPTIEADSEAKELYVASMEAAQDTYNKLVAVLYEKNYNEQIKAGISEKRAKLAAEKAAIEDARFVLPNACETKMILTMNARSLMNFFNQRCCFRAQWEIRELARQMLMLSRAVAPILFKNSGPRCLSGPCPEGKMSCGRMKEVRGIYGS